MKAIYRKLVFFTGLFFACLLALPFIAFSQHFIRDISFNDNQLTSNSQSRCIEVITSGPYKDKVMLAGLFTTYNNAWWPSNYPNVVRLNKDGSLDQTFRTDPLLSNADIYAIAVQADGKVVIGGVFTIAFGSKMPKDTLHNLARLNANGTLDETFNPNGGGFLGDNRSDDGVRDLLLNTGTDGKLKIWVAGFGEIYNGERIVSGAPGAYKGGLVILNSEDGSIYAKPMVANSPGTSGGGVFTMALRRDGNRVLIGGEFGAIGAVGMPGYVYCRRVASLLPDGKLDPLYKQVADLTGGPGNTVYAVAEQVQADNSTKIIIGGMFTTFKDNRPGAGGITNYSNLNYIARLNEDGALDNSFSNNVTAGFSNGNVFKVLADGKGRLIIGGGFTSYNGQPANRLVRLLPDGGYDASFDIGTGFTLVSGGFVSAPYIQDLAFQPAPGDANILVAGAYENFDGNIQQGYTIRLANATVLPEFISGFAVTKVNDKAQISFKGLLSEAEYTIERSLDGNRFTPVTTFKVNGMATTFSYNDPLSNTAAIYYYRIAIRLPAATKQSYSSIQRISNGALLVANIVRVSKTQVNISATGRAGIEEPLCVRIVSLNGQLLYQEKWTASKNTGDKRITIQDNMHNSLLMVYDGDSNAVGQPLLVR